MLAMLLLLLLLLSLSQDDMTKQEMKKCIASERKGKTNPRKYCNCKDRQGDDANLLVLLLLMMMMMMMLRMREVGKSPKMRVVCQKVRQNKGPMRISNNRGSMTENIC